MIPGPNWPSRAAVTRPARYPEPAGGFGAGASATAGGTRPGFAGAEGAALRRAPRKRSGRSARQSPSRARTKRKPRLCDRHRGERAQEAAGLDRVSAAAARNQNHPAGSSRARDQGRGEQARRSTPGEGRRRPGQRAPGVARYSHPGRARLPAWPADGLLQAAGSRREHTPFSVHVFNMFSDSVRSTYSLRRHTRIQEEKQ
jgi:hypothetical protein